MLRTLQLAAISALMMMAFTAAAGSAKPGAHHFIYYPGKQIYFAPDRQMWFWRDGDDWTTGAALPLIYQQYTRSGYNVYLDAAQPYDAHEQVSAGMRRHQWTKYEYGAASQKPDDKHPRK